MPDHPATADAALDGIDDAEQFRAIAREMETYLGDDSTGHDVAHAWRVFALGTDIAEEVGADTDTVGAAALTHDIHRAVADPGGYVDPAETLEDVRAVLDAAGFEGPVADVCHCVAVHDEYAYRGIDRPAETIEADVLRDADNLDAMGAVGVARTFMFSGDAGHPLWTPDADDYSAVDHFHEKLLRLREEMHTEPAQARAADRHAFLETFLDRLVAEWYGRR